MKAIRILMVTVLLAVASTQFSKAQVSVGVHIGAGYPAYYRVMPPPPYYGPRPYYHRGYYYGPVYYRRPVPVYHHYCRPHYRRYWY